MPSSFTQTALPDSLTHLPPCRSYPSRESGPGPNGSQGTKYAAVPDLRWTCTRRPGVLCSVSVLANARNKTGSSFKVGTNTDHTATTPTAQHCKCTYVHSCTASASGGEQDLRRSSHHVCYVPSVNMYHCYPTELSNPIKPPDVYQGDAMLPVGYE
ncbi:unnamed protein product [Cutaneotrichosporon oleaginosum]